MSGANDALAAILERGRSNDEAEAMLVALVDGGVYVPINERHSVMFISVDDTGPVLPAYTSEACREQWLPDAAGSAFCDGPRLIDIAEKTGVQKLALFAPTQWVKFPLALISVVLRERMRGDMGGKDVMLTWSTHPVAVALRNSFADRILRHPQVRCVWIAHARWAETGVQQLLVLIAVDEDAQPLADALMRTVIAEDLSLTSDDPDLAMMALGPAQAGFAAELDRKGLDTVRADHAANRVHIISQEFG
ncbi:hypothetical protein BJY16_007296 [Actinoplanes octamycinicus]|uniref:SseB protein N-terminal domain-containing protein n=1 Tax=Actinoplanes octamycinicus TaxID=135948 RepID=A0A7W7MBB2_9ACTN|nr:hypothetical protein [Actinoplanes octamycinicus]MBB4743837.1 hypothetical protein [Actinoplanes octamycinicus]GIE58466.1 hypothetical protein Aoc01nite_38680 [Actinoplanes octamycinicus]